MLWRWWRDGPQRPRAPGGGSRRRRQGRAPLLWALVAYALGGEAGVLMTVKNAEYRDVVLALSQGDGAISSITATIVVGWLVAAGVATLIQGIAMGMFAMPEAVERLSSRRRSSVGGAGGAGGGRYQRINDNAPPARSTALTTSAPSAGDGKGQKTFDYSDNSLPNVIDPANLPREMNAFAPDAIENGRVLRNFFGFQARASYVVVENDTRRASRSIGSPLASRREEELGRH